ncbi:MAG: hypothetical protein SF187_12100 [Deltaproteobacteria bacterium]|nr:hypothetical protein [Deltaproteobacteria bacterium]
MDAFLTLAAVVCAFALLGVISAFRWLFLVGRKPELVAVVASPSFTRKEKLEVVEELLGAQMPAALADELRRLRGLPPAFVAAPQAVAAPNVAETPALGVVSAADPEPFTVNPFAPLELAPSPVAAIDAPTTMIGGALGLSLDDRPFASAPEDARLAQAAHPWLRSLLSFENVIFLLAAALILGGTIYLLATTWGRVPSRWQAVYLEGALLFYGSILSGAAVFVKRKLQLQSPAQVIAMLAMVMPPAVAVVAGAGATVNAMGSVAGACAATLAAWATCFMVAHADAAPRLAGALFAGAVALLAAGVAAFDCAWPATGAALLVMSMLVAMLPLAKALHASGIRAVLVLLSLPAAIAVLPATVPASWPLLAPALLVTGFLAYRLLDQSATAVVSALCVLCVWMVWPHPKLLAATIAIAFSVAAVTSVSAAREARLQARLLSALLYIALAFAWTGRLGPDALLNQSTALVAAASLPFAIAAFAAALLRMPAPPHYAANGFEVIGLIILGLAQTLTAMSVTGAWTHALVTLAIAGIGYAYAARMQASEIWRRVLAHVFLLTSAGIAGGLFASWAIGSAVCVAALALMALRQPTAWWVGVLGAPVGFVMALSAAAPRWSVVALCAAFLVLLLVRTRDQALKPWRLAIYPAWLVVVYMALGYWQSNQAPWIAPSYLALSLVVASVPAGVFVGVRRRADLLMVEVGLALACLSAADAALSALVVLAALAFGRCATARRFVAMASLPVALLAMQQQAHSWLLGVLVAAVAARLLWQARPSSSHADDAAAYWHNAEICIGPVLFIAAQLLATMAPPQGALLPLYAAPLVVALGLVPFAFVASVWARPVLWVTEVHLGAGLTFVMSLLVAMIVPRGDRVAVAAGTACLVALACAVAACLRGPLAKGRITLVGTAIMAPVAVVAMTQSLWIAPVVAMVGAAALLLYGRLSGEPLLSRAGFLLSLPAAAWSLAAMGLPSSSSLTDMDKATVLRVGAAIAIHGCVATRWHRQRAGVVLRWTMRADLVLAMIVVGIGTFVFTSSRTWSPRFSSEELSLLLATTFWATLLALASRSAERVLAVTLGLAGAACAVALTWVMSAVFHRGWEALALAAFCSLAGLLAGTAKRSHPQSRLAWIVATFLMPVLVASCAPLDWSLQAGAAAAFAFVAVLCWLSKRRDDNVLGTWGLSLGAVAFMWALGAAAEPFSHGGDKARHLPLVTVALTVYAVLVGQKGKRIAACSSAVYFRVALGALAFAMVALVASVGLLPEPSFATVLKTEAALAVFAGGSLYVALRFSWGWAFYGAEGAVVVAYGYLRLRTNWLHAFGDWDGVAMTVFAFLGLAAERKLRTLKKAVGARESVHVAMLLPLVSAVLLDADSPVRAIGSAAASLFYLHIARRGGVYRLAAWAGVGLANASLINLWLHLDFTSPLLFAVPVGLSLAALVHGQAEALGNAAAPLKTIASLLVLGVGSWEAMRFTSPWPALALAALSILGVFVGIVWRTRAYLYLSFGALILDIVANVTRFGLRDRLTGALLGLGAGLVLLALGVIVARHKAQLLARYHELQEWQW